MHKTVIKPQTSFHIDLKELWHYKDLFLVLAYRDFRIRYAQTFLGFLWALIQPLITLSIFVLIFGKAVKVDTGGVPYPVFAVCGMSAWTYFAYVLSQSGNSIIGAQGMIKKIYFPRLVIPLSKAVVGLVDYCIVFSLLVISMIYYSSPPSGNIIFLPLFILLTVIAALAIGIWLSALTVRYRDFQHIIPFFVQFGLYLSPIGFPSEIVISRVPKWAGTLYYLNPMAGLADGIRWSILGGDIFPNLAYVSFVAVIILFLGGLIYFKKVERVMADIV